MTQDIFVKEKKKLFMMLMSIKLYTEITELAKKHKVSRSRIIRQILSEYLIRETTK